MVLTAPQPRIPDSPALLAREPEPLLREALGEALRSRRAASGSSLRDISELAAISPGYLSELERGRKEVSSELLASICSALDVTVSDVVLDAASSMALSAAADELAAACSTRG